MNTIEENDTATAKLVQLVRTEAIKERHRLRRAFEHGCFLLKEKKYERVIKIFRELLGRLPECRARAAALSNLGVAYEKTGKIRTALAAYRQANRIDPEINSAKSGLDLANRLNRNHDTVRFRKIVDDLSNRLTMSWREPTGAGVCLACLAVLDRLHKVFTQRDYQAAIEDAELSGCNRDECKSRILNDSAVVHQRYGQLHEALQDFWGSHQVKPTLWNTRNLVVMNRELGNDRTAEFFLKAWNELVALRASHIPSASEFGMAA